MLGEIAFWWILTAGVWLVTLSARTSSELAVMAVCTLPCAMLARPARRANAGRWQLRIGWLRWPLTMAGEVIPQTVQVWVYALRRTRPTIRAVPLPDEPKAVAAARRAAAVLTLATTPGTVVLDCDPRKRSVLVHLTGRRPSRLEQAVQR
ncbi:hypothetical protein BST12_03575 [Mycobacterium angelicum]|uniref:Uncharacterized protein n=1 Tax=Mycobacterium angelicum TaxID=470074 RepID=A0A1X0A5R8_MYCAN|nr:hypothetical protein BST12_03575 [Mycobacterium angelicum]